MKPPHTIHASTIALATYGVLIRGAPGAGKSALALRLIERGASGGLHAALVSDDRTVLEAAGGRLIAQAPEPLAGLIEIRGIGVCRGVRTCPAAVIGLCVDLVPGEALARMPEPQARRAAIGGIDVPALALADAARGDLGAKADAILAVLGLSAAAPAPDMET